MKNCPLPSSHLAAIPWHFHGAPDSSGACSRHLQGFLGAILFPFQAPSCAGYSPRDRELQSFSTPQPFLNPATKKASLEALQKKYCSSACCLLSLPASQRSLQGLKSKSTWESNNPAEGSGLQNLACPRGNPAGCWDTASWGRVLRNRRKLIKKIPLKFGRDSAPLCSRCSQVQEPGRRALTHPCSVPLPADNIRFDQPPK